MSAVNQRIEAAEGEDGTLVVTTAWCSRCGEQTVPHPFTGECGFCGTQIVDYDALRVSDVRAAMQQHAGIPTPLQVAEAHMARETHLMLHGDQAEVIQLHAPAADDERAIRLSPELALPIDVVGEAIAILAKRGAGKTNTGRVLAEELAGCGVHFVVIDPVGVWWGLRSSADGAHDGLALPILGGTHGDADLTPWSGAISAATAVDSGRSMLFDLSDFSKDDQRRFVADFAEELYQRKARKPSPLHLILEEADEFAPQRARGGGDAKELSRMRGAVEQLARRGRSRGIGMTMITQRSAALSKDVLTQADVLIAMRTTGPTDIKAIEEWIDKNADDAGDVVPSLPGLKTGEGWVWNPEREILARVKIRLARTFDSSSTPKFGHDRVDPGRMTPVELPTLGEETAEIPGQLALAATGDYRREDAQGRYGCKVEGCQGRSTVSRGIYAYLCDDLHAQQKRVEASAQIKAGLAAARARRAQRQAKPEPVEPEAALVPQELGGTVPLFGLTGDFARVAANCRAEAERLRLQADALDAIAAGIDQLAAMQ